MQHSHRYGREAGSIASTLRITCIMMRKLFNFVNRFWLNILKNCLTTKTAMFLSHNRTCPESNNRRRVVVGQKTRLALSQSFRIPPSERPITFVERNPDRYFDSIKMVFEAHGDKLVDFDSSDERKRLIVGDFRNECWKWWGKEAISQCDHDRVQTQLLKSAIDSVLANLPEPRINHRRRL